MLITHALVIDGLSKQPYGPASISIEDNRIKEIRMDGSSNIELLPNQDRSQIIDATGKFVIPGLIDMHVHVSESVENTKEAREEFRGYLRLFLQNGITSVRHTGGTLEQILLMKEEINEGVLDGPRIFCSGPLIDGKDPYWRTISLIAKDSETARKIVGSLAGLGVDFLKTYINLKPEVLRSVIEEAHRHGLPVTGHVLATTPIEAIELGIDGLEHMGFILYKGLVSAEKTMQYEYDEDWPAYYRWTGVDLEDESVNKLLKLIVERSVFICPTLVVFEKIWQLEGVDALENDPRLKDLPHDTLGSWKKYSSERAKKKLTRKSEEIAKLNFEIMKRMTGKLHKAGARIIAGSDTPNPYVIPGYSLHRELELLVESGLTPVEAIISATSVAAESLKKFHELGSVEEGKLADLVLLSADPLKDIRNLSNIVTVIKDGKIVP